MPDTAGGPQMSKSEKLSISKFFWLYPQHLSRIWSLVTTSMATTLAQAAISPAWVIAVAPA